MKYLYLLFIMTVALAICKAQDTVLIEYGVIGNRQPGKCYYSSWIPEIPARGKDLEGFLLEIKPATFRDTTLLLGLDQLEKFRIDSNNFSIPVRDKYYPLEFRNQDHKYFVIAPYPQSFVVCILEVKVEYDTLSTSELERINYTINRRKIVKHAQLIKKYVKQKPEHLREGQHYFQAGFWVDMREAQAYACINYMMLEVQKSLNARGYNVKESNNMDENTKEALFDFQAKNNLPVGQLDFATLEALGVEY